MKKIIALALLAVVATGANAKGKKLYLELLRV